MTSARLKARTIPKYTSTQTYNKTFSKTLAENKNLKSALNLNFFLGLGGPAGLGHRLGKELQRGGRRGFKSRPRLHLSGSGSLDEPSRPPFKVSSSLGNGMTEIHNYSRRLERFRRNISRHKYGSVALRFPDHLGALGLLRGRITKYAEHLPPLLKDSRCRSVCGG